MPIPVFHYYGEYPAFAVPAPRENLLLFLERKSKYKGDGNNCCAYTDIKPNGIIGILNIGALIGT